MLPSKGPERVILALAGLLFASLLCIAFLLGRLSSGASAPREEPGIARTRPEPVLAPRPETPLDRRPESARPTLENAAIQEAHDLVFGLLALEPERAPPPELPARTAAPEDPTIPRLTADSRGHPVIENEAAKTSPPGPNDAARGLAPDSIDDGAPRSSSPSSSRPSDASPARDEVEAYFTRVKQIQVQGEGEPGEVAQRMLSSFMQGDTSGFDALIHDLEVSEREAGSLRPPPACAEYHAQLIGLIRESRKLLGEVRGALGKNDAGGLAALTATAQRLQARAEAMSALESKIRAR